MTPSHLIPLLILVFFQSLGASPKSIPSRDHCQSATTLSVSNLSKGIELSPYLQYFTSETIDLSIEDVLKLESESSLISSRGVIPNFGNTDKVYWFCVRIQNTSPNLIQSSLYIKYPLLDTVQFYSFSTEGNFESNLQGRLYPFSNRKMMYRGFSYSVDLPPEQITTIFIGVATDSSMSVPLYISEEKSFLNFSVWDTVLQGFYFGIVGVMALYNLFVFFLVRDKAYFYYVVYLFWSAIIFQLSLQGLLPMFLIPNQPNLVWNLHNPLYFIFLFTCFPMSITFMNLKENAPKIYNLFRILLFIPIICLVLIPFLPYRFMNQTGDIISFLLAFLALFVSIYIAFFVKYRPARFYFYGYSVVIIGGITTVLKYMGVFPVNTFTENAFQISMAIEVILMAFGLGDRITLVRLEKEKLQVKAEVDKQKILGFQKELKLAQKLQESTLPLSPPFMERLKIKAGYIPASLIGGDFYDFVKTSEHTISCIIADVTGHGVPAAIEAAMLKIAYTQTISISDSPGEVLKNINTSLVGKYKNQLLTAATVYFDLQKGLIKIANAGHPGLYLMRKGDSTIQVLRPQGKLIGFSNDVFFTEESHSLQVGDRILLFTDGLWDMWEKEITNQPIPRFILPTQRSDGSGEMELLDWLGKNRDSNFESLFESIESTIRLQKLTSTADEDITFILFEVQTSA